MFYFKYLTAEDYKLFKLQKSKSWLVDSPINSLWATKKTLMSAIFNASSIEESFSCALIRYVWINCYYVMS